MARDDTPLAEIDVSNLSEEEIREITGKFSFTLQDYGRRLKVGDDWARLLQGHLFVDHVLSAMLTEAMRSPEHLSVDRISFAAKLDLAAALGLIGDEFRPFLARLNRLRNKLAHNLHFEVTEDQATELYDLSQPAARTLIDEEQAKNGYGLLFDVILCNLVLLDVRRQSLSANQLLDKKHRLALGTAMENVRRIIREARDILKS